MKLLNSFVFVFFLLLASKQVIFAQDISTVTLYVVDSTGKEIDLKKPIQFPDKIKILVKTYPQTDKVFLNENNYNIIATITQFRAGRSIAHSRYKDKNIDLTMFKGLSGDGFQINILSVNIIKPSNQNENVKIATPFMTFFVK